MPKKVILFSVVAFESVFMTMSSEEVPPQDPATLDEGKKEDGKNGGRKRDETPIEELYDLSKPIPKVRHMKSSRN